MEIDIGGIGKEYAVDRALALAAGSTDAPMLVNLGGDLRVSGPRRDGSPWYVAIEDVDFAGSAASPLELSNGALATSGDAHRYVTGIGARFGHVLDPHTGWPISGAPRSVTVHAPLERGKVNVQMPLFPIHWPQPWPANGGEQSHAHYPGPRWSNGE